MLTPIRNLLLLVLTLSPVLYLTGQPTAMTTAGRVSGSTTEDGVIDIYRGIPFAEPPVDSLRWRAPQPKQPWSGTLECTAFGPSPMQREPAPFSMWSEEYLIPKSPIGEDCLYLNVWAESEATDRPVLVWIYGGGFNSGGSGVPIYDGEAMARAGVVFVSINYRVGPFGFLAHPALSQESPFGNSGNYGLMDQIAALEWVRDNIAAFGGDPDRVTIAGQSAGSMSVNSLVASPLAHGLMQRAIGHSGAMITGKLATLAEAEVVGKAFAEKVGASSLAELRALSAEEIQAAAGQHRPIVDGYVLPRQISELLANGRTYPVDLMTGWNQDEGFGRPIKDLAEYQSLAKEQYGEDAEAFLKYYPATTDEEARQAQLDAGRDAYFGIQNFGWANLHSKTTDRPVYLYRFTRKVPGYGEYAKYGAFHTGEVPYAYGTLDFVNRPWETTDRELSSIMLGYWVNFVKSGNPNGIGLPLWPEYETGENQIILLGDEVKSSPLPDAERLYFMQDMLRR